MAASPTTAETKPSAAVGLLIFDGDCGFCTTAARSFRVVAGDAVMVMPWQGLDLGEHGLTQAECSTAVYWVQHGRNYRGADACVQALQACPGPLRLLGKLAAVPPFVWLARAVYPIIAKYRYKLPGATNACRIDQG